MIYLVGFPVSLFYSLFRYTISVPMQYCTYNIMDYVPNHKLFITRKNDGLDNDFFIISIAMSYMLLVRAYTECC